jgi:hypothetical protein
LLFFLIALRILEFYILGYVALENWPRRIEPHLQENPEKEESNNTILAYEGFLRFERKAFSHA